MKDVPENELFSAYLDGELTAAEQADVEQLLAASPAARQLVEELRALSATLQSLPVYKLSEDLSPQILRQAERRILAGPSEPSGFSLETESPTPIWRMIAGRLARPRTWIWPAAAVAVAILLAVFLPERRERVAHQPAEKSMASAAVSNVPASAEMPSIGAADKLALAFEPKSAVRPMKDSAPTAMLAAKPMAAEAEEKGAALVRMKERDEGRPAAQPGMMPAKPALTTPAPAASPVMVAKEAGAAPGLPGRPPEEKAEERGGMAAGATPRPMKAAKQGPLGAMQTAEKGLDGAIAPEEMWIVFCDVTAEAIGEGLLDQVLDRRHVVRTEPARKDTEQLDRAAARYAAPPAMKDKALSPRGGEGESSDKEGGAAGKLIYVHAQATSADLQAVLADLKAMPQMVASVSGDTVRVESEPFQAGRKAFSGKAFPPMKQASGEADRSGSKYAMDLKGAQQAPADSQPMQLQIGASPGMPNATGAGPDRAQARQSRTAGTVAGGAMPGQSKRQAAQTDNFQEFSRTAPPGMAGGQGAAQMSRVGGAVRSQTALGYGTLSSQQAAAAERAFRAGQQFVPPVRLNFVGPLPVDQPAPQLPVKRRVLFVLRVVDAGGIAAEKGQSSKAAAARVEPAGSKPAKSEAAKAAAPAQSAPSAKPTQEAPK